MKTEKEAFDQLKRELSDEIYKEARIQTSKTIVVAMAFLFAIALSGWWFYLQPKIQSLVGGIPTNGVVAFDTPNHCPDGWKEYSAGAGRFIVGTGKGAGLSERKYREEDGEELHMLTTEEMPSHNHPFTGDEIIAGGWGGTVTTNVGVGDNTAHRTYTPRGYIGSTGSDKPHNNMPPYIALKLCVKK